MIVSLTEQEWVQVLNAAALAPYGQIAPVITKMTEQLTQQPVAPVDVPQAQSGA